MNPFVFLCCGQIFETCRSESQETKGFSSSIKNIKLKCSLTLPQTVESQELATVSTTAVPPSKLIRNTITIPKTQWTCGDPGKLWVDCHWLHWHFAHIQNKVKWSLSYYSRFTHFKQHDIRYIVSMIHDKAAINSCCPLLTKMFPFYI